jgi:hypothetical protein
VREGPPKATAKRLGLGSILRQSRLPIRRKMQARETFAEFRRAGSRCSSATGRYAPALTLNAIPAGTRIRIARKLAKGDCMAPLHPAVSAVPVDKRQSYESGDLIVIFMKPETVKPGHLNVMPKRLASMPRGFPYGENPKSEVVAALPILIGRVIIWLIHHGKPRFGSVAVAFDRGVDRSSGGSMAFAGIAERVAATSS